MQLSFKKVAATFERNTEVTLSTAKWQYASLYLDDIVIFSEKAKVRFEHTRSIFCLLKETGVTLQVKKCDFSTNRIDYLGHMTIRGKLEVAIHGRCHLQVTRTKYCDPTEIVPQTLYRTSALSPYFRESCVTILETTWKVSSQQHWIPYQRENKCIGTLKKKLCSLPVLTLERRNG